MIKSQVDEMATPVGRIPKIEEDLEEVRIKKSTRDELVMLENKITD